MKRLLLILGMTVLVVGEARGQALEPAGEPAPSERSDPRFIESHAGVGVFAFYPLYFDTPSLGVDFSVTMRPSAAKSFYPSFERRNMGMNFGVTYVEITGQRRFFDAHLVFRQYARRMETSPGEDSPFAGLGFGVMGLAWDSEKLDQHNVSITAELGYEYRSIESMVLTFRFQARRLTAGPTNLSGVSFIMTAGWRTD